MDTKEAVKRKIFLEGEIARTVHELVNKFEEETQLLVSRVDITMKEATAIGDAGRRVVVAGCAVECQI